MAKASQLFDLGPVGVIKLYDGEDGEPVIQIFSGAEADGTPVIVTIYADEGVDAFIKLGMALRAYHQVPAGGKPQDSSNAGGLTIKPI